MIGPDPEASPATPRPDAEAPTDRGALPATRQLRHELAKQLPLDDELMEYLRDYHPQVARNCTNGMTRLQKENLLLESVEAELVGRTLANFVTSRPTLATKLPAGAPSAVPRRWAQHSGWRGALLLMGVSLMLAASWLIPRRAADSTALPDGPSPRGWPAAEPVSPTGAMSRGAPSPLLTTMPRISSIAQHQHRGVYSLRFDRSTAFTAQELALGGGVFIPATYPSGDAGALLTTEDPPPLWQASPLAPLSEPELDARIRDWNRHNQEPLLREAQRLLGHRRPLLRKLLLQRYLAAAQTAELQANRSGLPQLCHFIVEQSRYLQQALALGDPSDKLRAQIDDNLLRQHLHHCGTK